MNEINKLDYCVSLRERGIASNEIKKMLKDQGLDPSQIQYYIKKSDDIFLERLIQNKNSRDEGKTKNRIKTTILILSLLLLLSAFLGYIQMGLTGLFIVWSLIGYSSFSKK